MNVRDLLELFKADEAGDNPVIRKGEDKYLLVAFIPNRRELPVAGDCDNEPIGYDLVGPLSDEVADTAPLVAANVMDAINVKFNKRLISCSAHIITGVFTEYALESLHINANLDVWRNQMEERSKQMGGK